MESRGGWRDWNETNRARYLSVSAVFMKSRSLLTLGDLAMSDEEHGDNGDKARLVRPRKRLQQSPEVIHCKGPSYSTTTPLLRSRFSFGNEK